MLKSRRILSVASGYVNEGSLLRHEEKHFPIIDLHNPSQRTSARFISFFELTSKTEIERRRARIKDEMSRSYFQDIADLNKHNGKISKANKVIIPATSALKFPTLEVDFPVGYKLKLPLKPHGNEANLSTSNVDESSSLKGLLTSKTNDTNAPTSDTAKASLICLSFRASAGVMLESWISPFQKTFVHSSDVRLYEVSFIDSWLLSHWPIKNLLIKLMRRSAPAGNQDVLKRQIGYSFGDNYYFRKDLEIINRLTGYVFLVDSLGRIRWKGNGAATEEELVSLLSCTSVLLEERVI